MTVIYHSPLTSMTLIRIARPHIRILHAAITLLTTIDGRAVLPRVVGVSGTVKKAQGRIMVYHRAVIAQMLARFDEGKCIRI
jgi:ribonuclease P/MRP protein subunit POP5